MKLSDDGAYLAVGENGIVFWQFQAAIEEWMSIQDAWLGTVVSIGTAEAAGVGELQSNEQPVVGTGDLAMFGSKNGAQSRQ